MNKTLTVLAVAASSVMFAQQAPGWHMTPKEAEKHAKEIEKSKEKNSVIWDYDTVYSSGVPWCIIYKVEKGFLVHDDYSIRSLSGQELIYVRYGTYIDYYAAHAPNTAPPTIGYYSYIFSDTHNTGEILTTAVYKEVARFNLISNDGMSINPNGEGAFISANPVKYSIMQPPPPPPPVVVVQPAPTPPPPVVVVQPAPIQQTVAPQPAPIQQTVAPQPAPIMQQTAPVDRWEQVHRDRHTEISVRENNIYQDGRFIGTIQYSEETRDGRFVKHMSVFLPNGVEVARMSTPRDDRHFWRVKTFRDNAEFDFNSHSDEERRELVRYLVENRYL